MAKPTTPDKVSDFMSLAQEVETYRGACDKNQRAQDAIRAAIEQTYKDCHESVQAGAFELRQLENDRRVLSLKLEMATAELQTEMPLTAREFNSHCETVLAAR